MIRSSNKETLFNTDLPASGPRALLAQSPWLARDHSLAREGPNPLTTASRRLAE
jgi:hypothetical protein